MNLHNQNKDRKNWHESIQYRKNLIAKASELGLILNNPHNMKIKELAELVDKAERWSRNKFEGGK